MNKFKLVFLIFIITSLLFSVNVFADNQSRETTDTYTVLPGSKEWDELITVENKIEACRIPDDTLGMMSDAELVQAIIDYPFIIDVFLGSDYEDGVESLLNNCDALNELMMRGTAKEAIINFLDQRYKDADLYGLTAKEEYQNDALCILLVCLPECYQNLSIEDIYFINNHTKMVQIPVDLDNNRGYIYTPNGTPVYFTNPSCSHNVMLYHATMDSNTVSTYGVSLISQGTCKYNCHSYAWFSKATSNNVWISNSSASAFITDGSYSCLTSGINATSNNVYMNYRVTYGSYSAPLHSACISDNNVSATLGNRHVKSKWGIAGVFEHYVWNVPSNYWDTNHTVSAWA